MNENLVNWCKSKKLDGFELVLWSARGEKYSRLFAEKHFLTDIFDKIISKPGYIVDDKGWQWLKFTRVISFSEFNQWIAKNEKQ